MVVLLLIFVFVQEWNPCEIAGEKLLLVIGNV